MTTDALGLVTSWLLTYAVHSTVLIGAVWLAFRWRRVPSHLLRETFWKCALAGGLVTTTAQLVLGLAPAGGRWELAEGWSLDRSLAAGLEQLRRGEAGCADVSDGGCGEAGAVEGPAAPGAAAAATEVAAAETGAAATAEDRGRSCVERLELLPRDAAALGAFEVLELRAVREIHGGSPCGDGLHWLPLLDVDQLRGRLPPAGEERARPAMPAPAPGPGAPTRDPSAPEFHWRRDARADAAVVRAGPVRLAPAVAVDAGQRRNVEPTSDAAVSGAMLRAVHALDAAPAAQPVLGARSAVAAATAAAATTAGASASRSAGIAAPREHGAVPGAIRTAEAPDGAARPATLALLGLWAAGAAWGTARLLAARIRFGRRLGARRAVADASILASVERLRRAAGLRRAVRVTTARGLAVPIALGRDEICLPARALRELHGAEREAMLAHELAHLARRDPAWLLLGQLVERAFFFQPLNRVARRAVQEAAEFQCDAWAVRHGGGPLTMARCLAEVARWIAGERAAPAPVTAMAESRSGLLRRIHHLAEQRGAEGVEPRARWRGPAVLGVLVAVVLLAPGVATQQAQSGSTDEPSQADAMRQRARAPVGAEAAQAQAEQAEADARRRVEEAQWLLERARGGQLAVESVARSGPAVGVARGDDETAALRDRLRQLEAELSRERADREALSRQLMLILGEADPSGRDRIVEVIELEEVEDLREALELVELPEVADADRVRALIELRHAGRLEEVDEIEEVTLHEVLREADAQLRRELEAARRELDCELEELEALYEEREEEREALADELEDLEDEHVDLADEREMLDEERRELEAELRELQNERDVMHAELDAERAQLEMRLVDIERCDRERQRLHDELGASEDGERRRELERALDELTTGQRKAALEVEAERARLGARDVDLRRIAEQMADVEALRGETAARRDQVGAAMQRLAGRLAQVHQRHEQHREEASRARSDARAPGPDAGGGELDEMRGALEETWRMLRELDERLRRMEERLAPDEVRAAPAPADPGVAGPEGIDAADGVAAGFRRPAAPGTVR